MLPFQPVRSGELPATYEEFLRAELTSLGRRLLQKHQEELDPGKLERGKLERGSSSFLGGFLRTASPSEAQVSLPKAKPASPSLGDVFEKMISEEPEGEMQPCTQTELRWAELTVSLLEDGDDDSDGGENKVMSVWGNQEQQLRLRGSWQFSWSEARRLARQRTQDRPLQFRFNEVVEDNSWLQQFVVGPDSKIQFTWALLSTIFIVWDMTTIPLEIFPMTDLQRITFAVAVASLGFWILDVPTHAFFGCQSRGVIEMRPAKLLWLYARSWLLIDVMVIFVDITVITLEFIRAADMNPLFRSGRFLRTVRLIRLIRLLRVAKLERQVMVIAHKLLSTYSLMALRVIGYLAVMLAMNHLIACCWYGLGTYTKESGRKSWLDSSDINQDSVSEAYVASLHWSLTQFTPATNPIAPENAWERFYAIWVILLAMACFSSFIGSIGTTITSMRTVRRTQLLEESKLEVFFTERNLSLDLFERVKGALLKDKQARTRLREDEVKLIDGVPETVKIRLHKEMYISSLLKLPIWPTWGHQEDADLMHSLCHQALTEHTCRPGQDVFMPHNLCQMVYVIQSGSLEYSIHEQEPDRCPGDSVLCLPSLWAEWPHIGRLTATFGTCFYVGVCCKDFSMLAAQFGGPLCEYLKIFGILLLSQIEALQAAGKLVTDISAQADIDTRVLTSRAERFATLKEKSALVMNRSSSRQRFAAAVSEQEVISM